MHILAVSTWFKTVMVPFSPCVLAFLLTSGVVSSVTQTKPSGDELRAFGESLDGKLVLPDDPTYDKLRQMKDTSWTTTPAYIVVANSADDVRRSLALARKHYIQPTVVSSGHDYNGRSTAKDSLNIDMSSMKKVTIDRSDSASDTGISATLETGNSFRDLYEMLDKENLLLVGGSGPTVALGGYFQGGGHSPLTRSLGLGVDSVIGITMVTADGRLIYVDAAGVHPLDPASDVVEPDHDLFWALLGGGGGNLGVVISFKVKLHQPPPAFTSMFWSMAMKHPSCGDHGYDVMQKVLSWFHDNVDDHKLGGYVIFNNLPGDYFGIKYTGVITLSMLYTGPWEEAWPVFKPMYNYKAECIPVKSISNVSKFWDFQKNANDPTGFPIYLINRLLQKDDLKKDAFVKLVSKDIYGFGVPMGCTGTFIGGKARTESGNPTSVGPQLRSAVNSLSCGTASWESEEQGKFWIQNLKKFREQFNNYGNGVYYNEPDCALKDWKTDFWGMDNYNRLLEVKKHWDKDGMFWCYHCVGSDIKDPWSKYTVTGIKAATCGSINISFNTFLLGICAILLNSFQ